LLEKSDIQNSDPIALAESYDDYAFALKVMGRAGDAESAGKEASRIRTDNPGKTANFKPVRYNQSCSDK